MAQGLPILQVILEEWRLGGAVHVIGVRKRAREGRVFRLFFCPCERLDTRNLGCPYCFGSFVSMNTHPPLNEFVCRTYLPSSVCCHSKQGGRPGRASSLPRPRHGHHRVFGRPRGLLRPVCRSLGGGNGQRAAPLGAEQLGHVLGRGPGSAGRPTRP